jgi:hypothetical protein
VGPEGLDSVSRALLALADGDLRRRLGGRSLAAFEEHTSERLKRDLVDAIVSGQPLLAH